MCIPVVIYVFAIVWIVLRVKVEGFWIVAVPGVGAPHVSGGGLSGCLGGDMVFLGGVGADKLPLLSEQGRVAR